MGERADMRIKTDSDTVYSESYENKDPQEIREDIKQTRAEISETVNIIQEKLSPDHLKWQAEEMVRDATIGRIETMTNDISRKARGVRRGVMDTIKDNPIPTALMGIGLGWLIMEGWNRSSDYEGYYVDRTRYYPVEGSTYYEPGDEYRSRSRVRETFDEARTKTNEMASQAQDKVSEMTDEARRKVSEVSDQARHKAEEIGSEVRHQVDHLTTEAQEQMEYIGHQAQYQARRAQSQMESMMESNPLAVGAAALALGMLVGFSLPATEQEDRMMGRTRDDLLDKAEDVAEDTMEKVERVAEKAGRTVEEEAKRQNLTVADVSEEVQRK